MISYRYNEQVTPPAPFVRVSVASPLALGMGVEVPAQIATAADMTVVPLRVVEALGLVALDEVPIFGFGGHCAMIRTYLVSLQVHDLPPTKIKALVSPDEPYVLLGRDILNGFKITFDGPRRMLVIE